MAQPWRRVICGPGMQPEGVSVLHSSGVSLHGSKSGASSRVCSSSSAVGAVAAFIYGDPAGSRSDARAASLICGAAAVSEPLSDGVSMRGLEHRPLLVVRQVSADAGLARPTATGDSVSEELTASSNMDGVLSFPGAICLMRGVQESGWVRGNLLVWRMTRYSSISWSR